MCYCNLCNRDRNGESHLQDGLQTETEQIPKLYEPTFSISHIERMERDRPPKSVTNFEPTGTTVKDDLRTDCSFETGKYMVG
jgi:hypothetical protein